jgi:hypothetical protein
VSRRDTSAYEKVARASISANADTTAIGTRATGLTRQDVWQVPSRAIVPVANSNPGPRPEMGPLTITTWRSVREPWGHRRTVSWEEFVNRWAAGPEPTWKKDISGFSLAAFKKDGRALRSVERVFALGLDFDQGDTSFEEAARLFPRRKGVVYTTWSSTPEHLKLRGIWPFSRPVRPDEYESIWVWAATRAGRHGHIVDAGAKDPSRFWYVPSYHPNRFSDFAYRELKGVALDVEEILRTVRGSRFRPMPGLVAPEREIGTGAGGGQPGNGRNAGARIQFVGPAAESFWGVAFTLWGRALDVLADYTLTVECPWASVHSRGSGTTESTVIRPPTSAGWWGLFKCSHGHCARRKTLDLLDVVPAHILADARESVGTGLARGVVVGGQFERRSAYGDKPALARWRLNLADADGVVLPELHITCPTPGYESAREVFQLAFPGLRWTKVLETLDGWRARGLLPWGRAFDVAIRGGKVTWLRPVREVGLWRKT